MIGVDEIVEKVRITTDAVQSAQDQLEQLVGMLELRLKVTVGGELGTPQQMRVDTIFANVVQLEWLKTVLADTRVKLSGHCVNEPGTSPGRIQW